MKNDAKSWLIGKDPDAWKDLRARGDGWMASLTQRTLVDSEGQESLACCIAWGCNESDTTWQLNNNYGGTKLIACLAPLLSPEPLSWGQPTQDGGGGYVAPRKMFSIKGGGFSISSFPKRSGTHWRITAWAWIVANLGQETFLCLNFLMCEMGLKIIMCCIQFIHIKHSEQPLGHRCCRGVSSYYTSRLWHLPLWEGTEGGKKGSGFQKRTLSWLPTPHPLPRSPRSKFPHDLRHRGSDRGAREQKF